MDSGVATRPFTDMDAYRERLRQFLWRTGLLMKPVFDAARINRKRVAFADGEEEVVLRAVQVLMDDQLVDPILIGRPAVIAQRVEKLGLRIRPGEEFEIVNPESDPRYWDYWTTYHSLLERRGVSPDSAKAIVRTHNSVIGSLMVHRGDADALLAGLIGEFQDTLRGVLDVIGLRPGGEVAGTLGVLATETGPYFICDTHVNPNPSAEQIAEITLMAADKVRLFGVEPRIALLSHSSFGSHDDPSARKMQRALEIIVAAQPELEVEGEMAADMALDVEYRKRVFPNSRLKGPANLLVMPDLDSAHIAFNLSRVISDSVTVGPILMGAARPAHVLTPSATVRRVVNMAAIAAVEAQLLDAERQESKR